MSEKLFLDQTWPILYHILSTSIHVSKLIETRTDMVLLWICSSTLFCMKSLSIPIRLPLKLSLVLPILCCDVHKELTTTTRSKRDFGTSDGFPDMQYEVGRAARFATTHDSPWSLGGEGWSGLPVMLACTPPSCAN